MQGRNTMEKREKKHTLLKLTAIIFSLAFICYAAYQYYNQQQILSRQEERLQQLTQQKQALDDQLESINKLIDNADSPAYAEQYLRDKLGMIKDGEIIFDTGD